jgi:hypothetical protein
LKESCLDESSVPIAKLINVKDQTKWKNSLENVKHNIPKKRTESSSETKRLDHIRSNKKSKLDSPSAKQPFNDPLRKSLVSSSADSRDNSVQNIKYGDNQHAHYIPRSDLHLNQESHNFTNDFSGEVMRKIPHCPRNSRIPEKKPEEMASNNLIHRFIRTPENQRTYNDYVFLQRGPGIVFQNPYSRDVFNKNIWCSFCGVCHKSGNHIFTESGSLTKSNNLRSKFKIYRDYDLKHRESGLCRDYN